MDGQDGRIMDIIIIDSTCTHRWSQVGRRLKSDVNILKNVNLTLTHFNLISIMQ